MIIVENISFVLWRIPFYAGARHKVVLLYHTITLVTSFEEGGFVTEEFAPV
jgi:hypothetical protein